MEIRLHANATTTPKPRAHIQRSSRPAAELAVELGVSETTVLKWIPLSRQLLVEFKVVPLRLWVTG